ncbi:MAG: hypothetical protein MK105_07925 [Crocinitomicaceae bacterium]|nr:hypothetical protein [Crocinitomicaceae bacterium]
MIVEASVTGLFRTLLIIGGVFLLLRFIGQFMIAKRNMEEEREYNSKKRKIKKEKQAQQESEGKIKILGKNLSNNCDIQDVDFEEID